MADTDDDEGVYCPECNGTNIVKNGKVRNIQRFQCKPCGFNFVSNPKHRWPPSAKMLALMLLKPCEVSHDPTEVVRVDRWLLEAKEHHPWFVRALAEHAVTTAKYDGQVMEATLTRTWELYAFITGRDLGHFYDAVATELYLDMFKIADEEFQDDLVAWLKTHSSETSEIDYPIP